MLYDAHCHLQDARLQPFGAEILNALREIGVSKLVVNGTREADWPAVLEVASACDMVVPAIGLHPWYLRERSASWRADLVKVSPPAIGEIGLDRWMPNYDSAEQEIVFVEQLRMAASLNRPVSIHCLKAWGRLLKICFLPKRSQKSVSFRIWNSGPAGNVSSICRAGCYFPPSGYFSRTREKPNNAQSFARLLERSLIETDSPDMQLPEELQEFTLPEDTLILSLTCVSLSVCCRIARNPPTAHSGRRRKL